MTEGQAPTFVRRYTVLLMLLGIGFVLGAVVNQSMIGRSDDDTAWALRLVRNIEIVLALACLGVAALRALESRVASTATAALSILLAVGFPLGTALFIYWLVSVRKRESG